MNQHSYAAGFNDYAPVPKDLVLKKVILVVRHGDRCQISRDLGPKVKATDTLQAFWNAKLPSTTKLREINAIATLKYLDSNPGTQPTGDGDVYSGSDAKNSPYGMLTEVGTDQLVQVGKILRMRYTQSFIPSASSIYSRSTNICRTILSLKSLLHGMSLDTTATIIVPSGTDETMYPQAGGPCLAMIRRRNLIFNEDLFQRDIGGYVEIEKKIRTILGYEDKVNWVVVKEILCCHSIHGYPLPEGISEADVDKITDIAAFSWGLIFRDDELNRLGIGRFCNELLADMENIHNNHTKMSIYSGHDSTLVPLLCALQIYNDKWPPYASYLTLEVAEEDPGRWVRVLYNDVPALFPGDAALTRDGLGTWWPYSHLQQRLQLMAMTNSEYSSTIRSDLGADDIALTKDTDIKTTVTG